MNTETITSRLNQVQALTINGLSQRHEALLLAFVEYLMRFEVLEDGETTAQMSKYELHLRTGLSIPQVTRTLADLVDRGFLVRTQLEKKTGEKALTMLTDKAFNALGIEGVDALDSRVPASLARLLIAQPASVVRGVCAAWEAGVMPDSATERSFCGTSLMWQQVVFLLRGRVEAIQTELAMAVEDEAQLETPVCSVPVELRLRNGETYEIMPRGVDLTFVTRVLRRMDAKGSLSGKQIPQLVADIGWSRHHGFLQGRNEDDAVRILSACASKPSWKRPLGMPSDVVTAAAKAVIQQGGRIRTAN